MDFDFAVQRLAKDHKKIKTRKPVVVSEKAKRVAELQRRQQAELQARRQRERREAEFQRLYWTRCNRSLGVKSISGRNDANDDGVDDKGSSTPSLQLKATSIHGEGDKISFAPSVLETLMAKMPNDKIGTPWSFRIGILNPNYTFPASPVLQMFKPPPSDDDEDNAMDVDDGDDDYTAAYLDELNYKYIAYRHCSVIEFTQDEGHVGIPRPIASALLDPENRPPHFANFPIPITRTLDPSSAGSSEEMTIPEESEEMATPGHVAYNAFDVPNLNLEVSLVKLPKGTGCTLVPTQQAIQGGFYGLKDVKLVLEQSIVRTRLTLSMGDIVSTWHRGVKFDLKVTKVLPPHFQAISCFNTDIAVDIGETTSSETEPHHKTLAGASFSSGSKDQQEIGKGHVLGSSTATEIEKHDQDQKPDTMSGTPPPSGHPSNTSSVSLRPEPPEEQTENVVLVQIRHSSGSDKRRLDVSVATVQDLLDFAATLNGKSPAQFRLVTRFPRRVFTDSMGSEILNTVGISPGQEMFMVEEK